MNDKIKNILIWLALIPALAAGFSVMGGVLTYWSVISKVMTFLVDVDPIYGVTGLEILEDMVSDYKYDNYESYIYDKEAAKK